MKHIYLKRFCSVVLIIFSIVLLFSCTGNEGDTIYMTSYEVPGIPGSVQVVAGDGEVTIRWSPVTGATSYNIYWNTASGVTTADDVIISASSPYVQTGLTNGTTYYYVVTAVNIEGESAVSSEASAAPVDSSAANVPSTPTGVTAAGGDGQVTVSWSPSSGATSYNIYWNTSGSVTTADSAVISAPSPYVHMGLTNGTTYYYAVTAINNDGESALSTEVSATTGGSDAPPATPTGLQAAAGGGEVVLSWSPSSRATSYNIYWNTSGSVTTSDDVIISAPSPYVHMWLTNGTTYYYAVTAVNNIGESAISAEVDATPQAGAGESPPATPTGLQATAGDGEVTLSWNPVAGATSYNIYWGVNQGVTTSDSVILNALSPYTHTGLTNNTTYYYVVTASNKNGTSAASGEVSAMPRMSFLEVPERIMANDAQVSDVFGQSVAISGDYAIAGAPGEDGGTGNPATGAGAAYIYHRTGQNTWDAGTKLYAPDIQMGDNFGISVAIDGDYAIVGAWAEDGGAGDPAGNAGAAYIYHRTGVNTWDAGTKIYAYDAQMDDNFGVSVAISVNYAIVGAHGEDGGSGDPLTDAGAVYVFRRTGTNNWDPGTKIVSSDLQAGDNFGWTVSISGDYAVVGAYNEAGGPGDPLPNAGAAYIFHRTGTNTWDNGTKIVADDAQTLDRFGRSVSISGDYLVVGADAEDGGPGDPDTNAGAAYIFRRTGTNTWDTGTKIVAVDLQPYDNFGQSASISGDYVVVGAYNEDGGAGDPITGAGAAYIYHRTGLNSWDAGMKIVAPDAQTIDYFGQSVSISGNHAIVGAYVEDGGLGDPLTDAGTAYIY